MVVGDGKGWWSQARKRGAAVGGLAALRGAVFCLPRGKAASAEKEVEQRWEGV